MKAWADYVAEVKAEDAAKKERLKHCVNIIEPHAKEIQILKGHGKRTEDMLAIVRSCSGEDMSAEEFNDAWRFVFRRKKSIESPINIGIWVCCMTAIVSVCTYLSEKITVH